MRHAARRRIGSILALAVLLTAALAPGGAGRLPLPGAQAGRLLQSAGTPTAAATLTPTAAITATMVPGEVVVRFRDDTGSGPVGMVRAQARVLSDGVPAAVERPLNVPNGYVVGVTPGHEAAAAASLNSRPDVASADPNLVRHVTGRPAPALSPNDPLYGVQWAFPHIGAPAAWAHAQTNSPLVAVLDTGIDLNHPEFAGRIVPGANFVTPGAPPQDDNGHGTHVAGIIAAAGNNGVGGAGVAWNARVLPIKVADSGGGLTSEAWINGLSYAIQQHAQVVNMSFGGPTFSATEQSYIDQAWAAGLVIVASAGNSGDTTNEVDYPAAYDHVLSVAATGSDDARAYYSQTNRFVAVAAPGGNARFSNDPNDRFILSTWPLNLPSNYQTGYGREVGTSQAAAFVSGLAALMLSTGVGWTNTSIVQRIESSARDLGPPGRDASYGYGLIDAAAAVANPPGPPPGPTPTATPAPRPTATPGPRPTATPTPLPADCVFADVCRGRDPFAPFVEDLVRRGAVAGYRDLTFRPAAIMTRAEAAKVLVLVSGFPLVTVAGPHFADVPPTHPLYPYVETAYSQGLLRGYAGGRFRPDAGLTRGELAKLVVLARGWPLLAPATGRFRDVPYGSAFFFYVETAADLQVIAGYADLTFRPDRFTPRAEAAQVIDLAAATFRPAGGALVPAGPGP